MANTAGSQFEDRLKQAMAETKGEEINVSMPEVRNGIAKFDNFKFGEYKTGRNKGKTFLYISGTAVEPDVNHEGQRVKGLSTGQILPLDDGAINFGEKKDFIEHWREVKRQLYFAGIDVDQCDDLHDLEAILKRCVEDGDCYFCFSVSKREGTGKNEGRFFFQERWSGTDGLPPGYQGPQVDYELESDNTESSNEVEERPELVDDDEQQQSWKDLGTLADDGDPDAIDSLTQLASEAGVNPDDYPDSWMSLAEALDSSGSDEQKR